MKMNMRLQKTSLLAKKKINKIHITSKVIESLSCTLNKSCSHKS